MIKIPSSYGIHSRISPQNPPVTSSAWATRVNMPIGIRENSRAIVKIKDIAFYIVSFFLISESSPFFYWNMVDCNRIRKDAKKPLRYI